MEEIAQAESSQLFSSGNVTFDECQQLPYLQAVIKEAMRLHPGIGFPLERYVPSEGANLGGYSLAPGTIVGVNPHVIHRNKAVYGEDADAFRPERWIEASKEEVAAMDRTYLTVTNPHHRCP